MIIIFDLDYTLMETERLHDKLAEIFNEEDYRADYQECFKNKGINFNGEKYLALLKSQGRISEAREKDLKLKLAELMENMDSYLKPNVFEALEYFKQSGHKLVLVTFGNKKWQEEKVKNLSIKKYFDEIIFEDKDKSKSEFLKSLGEGNEEVLIINDNFREIEEMKKILGEKAKALIVEGKYNKEAEPHIKNLQELIPEEKRRENTINLK